jgi:hypothetical protein
MSNSEIKISSFIAQEVDSAANACGFTSSIVRKPANSTDPYTLAYAEIVVPLVKAVQELSKSNDSMKQHQKIIDSLIIQQKTKDSILTATVNNLMAQVANCCTQGAVNKTNNSTGINDSINKQYIILSLPNAATLGDAQPNPNNGSTQIPYFIPDKIIDAQIIFIDMLGKEIQKKSLQSGYGLLNIDTQNLPTGVYTYSLVVDDKVIDSKKMARTK